MRLQFPYTLPPASAPSERNLSPPSSPDSISEALSESLLVEAPISGVTADDSSALSSEATAVNNDSKDLNMSMLKEIEMLRSLVLSMHEGILQEMALMRGEIQALRPNVQVDRGFSGTERGRSASPKTIRSSYHNRSISRHSMDGAFSRIREVLNRSASIKSNRSPSFARIIQHRNSDHSPFRHSSRTKSPMSSTYELNQRFALSPTRIPSPSPERSLSRSPRYFPLARESDGLTTGEMRNLIGQNLDILGSPSKSISDEMPSPPVSPPFFSYRYDPGVPPVKNICDSFPSSPDAKSANVTQAVIPPHLPSEPIYVFGNSSPRARSPSHASPKSAVMSELLQSRSPSPVSKPLPPSQMHANTSPTPVPAPVSVYIPTYGRKPMTSRMARPLRRRSSVALEDETFSPPPSEPAISPVNSLGLHSEPPGNTNSGAIPGALSRTMQDNEIRPLKHQALYEEFRARIAEIEALFVKSTSDRAPDGRKLKDLIPEVIIPLTPEPQSKSPLPVAGTTPTTFPVTNIPKADEPPSFRVRLPPPIPPPIPSSYGERPAISPTAEPSVSGYPMPFVRSSTISGTPQSFFPFMSSAAIPPVNRDQNRTANDIPPTQQWPQMSHPRPPPQVPGSVRPGLAFPMSGPPFDANSSNRNSHHPFVQPAWTSTNLASVPGATEPVYGVRFIPGPRRGWSMTSPMEIPPIRKEVRRPASFSNWGYSNPPPAQYYGGY